MMGAMKISLCSVMVKDQEAALRFYTGVLGFVPKEDIPMGQFRWLTVVSPEVPDGTELVLEPLGSEAAKTFQAALHASGTPLTAFSVADVDAEYARLKAAGVVFKVEPTAMGAVKVAVFDDTCGNWINLYQKLAV